MKKQEVDDESRDLAAFISRGLLAVHDLVEQTVRPWEKRDYWVKADKFRLEWAWTKILGEKMVRATLDGEWGTVAVLAAEVGQKLSKIQVSERHRMGRPWVGAWEKLLADPPEG